MGRLLRAAVCSLTAVVLAGAAPGGGAGPAPENGTDRARSRAELLDLMGDGGATRAQVGDVATLLMEKRQLVIVAIAGKKARLASLGNSIDRIHDDNEKVIAADAALLALIKGLDLLNRQLTLAQSSGASPAELALRQTDVARHAIMIDERREEIRGRAFDGSLSELMRCRINVVADIEELDATLAAIDAQLSKAAKVQAGDRA